MPQMMAIFLLCFAVLSLCGTVTGDITGLEVLKERKHALDSFAWKANEEFSLRNGQMMELLRATTANLSHGACRNATMSWMKSVEKAELWALRFIDAAGKFPTSGMLVGNVFSIGSFWECVNTSEPANKYNYSYTPIRGQYCAATLGLVNQTSTSALPIQLKWGVCIPEACNATELEDFLGKALQSADGLPFVGRFVKNVAILNTVCQLNDVPYTALGILGILLIVVFGVLVFVGTAYDTLFEYSHGHILEATRVFVAQFAVSPFKGVDDDEALESDRTLLVPDENLNASQQSIGERKKAVEINNASSSNNDLGEPTRAVIVHLDAHSNDAVQKTALGRLMSVFSLRVNGAAIFSTKQSGDQLGCLHGIRFISMVWIITGHTYGASVIFPADTLLALQHYLQSWTFQVMWNATFSVDTFFVISGLLTTYVTMRYISRVGSAVKFKWHLFYLHRYLRLTPVYGIAIFLYLAIIPYISYGPQAVQKADQACVDYWWTNMLYVNNFYNISAQCFGHAWYLANDMQFFIISPLVLIPLWMAPVIGMFAIFLLVAISITSTAVITAINKFSALVLDNLGMNQATDSLGPINQGDDIYVKPYCRVGAYAIGMLVGYILFRTKRKLNLNAWVVLLGWTVSTALAITVLWCLYNPISQSLELTTAQNVAYLSLSRIAWSISIGWVILACTTGYGGWVNSLLSWKAFAPLGRLTYCAYLVHPTLLPLILSFVETAVDLREFPMYYYAAGNVIMAYVVALGLSLMFEAPFLGIEKLIFGRD